MRAAGFIKVLAAVFSGLALLLLIGLVSLSHAPGRALVIEVMDGREISAVGVVNLSDPQFGIPSFTTCDISQ